MSALITVAGFHDIRQEFIKESMHSLQWIAKSTLELRSAVARSISSSDMEVFLIPRGDEFNPRFMTDLSSDDRKGAIKISDSREVVFCTTDLGLKCINGAIEVQGIPSVEDILLMPKVLLQSTVDEMVAPTLEFYSDS